jgi:hypothetical protein
MEPEAVLPHEMFRKNVMTHGFCSVRLLRKLELTLSSLAPDVASDYSRK